MDATKVSFSKARNLIRKSDCAYLYSNGDLYLVVREEFKGKRVEFKYLIKGYIQKVRARDWDRNLGETFGGHAVEDLCRVVIHSPRAFGALFLAGRPEAAEFNFNTYSDLSEKAGYTAHHIRFHFAGNISMEAGYLSRRGQYDSVFISHGLTFQRNATPADDAALRESWGPLDGLFTLDEQEQPAAEQNATTVQ